ncbi:helix-turn-helix domain-containing protein [Streptomyces sp900116325]|uniref:helix-turn-helix domain-containing protein n=1 Tax=Streptomyces sp. 900116325 TaxID=3154295 RepID=UPI00339FF922
MPESRDVPAPTPPTVDSSVEASAADRATAQLAKVVASARRTAGLTLAATAAGSGLSPAYISQIESGSANPTVRSLAQLAGVLGLELHELLGAERGDTSDNSPFPARFTTLPGLTAMSDSQGIWNMTAHNATVLHSRLIRGEPGDHARPIRHAGEELVVVLAGQCRLRVSDTARVLNPADACHFAASEEHQITQTSDDLLLLVVLTKE